MKILFVLIWILSLPGYALDISRTVHANSHLPFLTHQGLGPFDTYLTMEVNYPPVQRLLNDLQYRFPQKLQSRGEAHITVITPVEYFQVLGKYLSMHEINQVALENRIQASGFLIVCLGQGRLEKDSTFYIVVESPDLLKIRQRIKSLYLAKGGDRKAFDPSAFYPHITLGFTTRDLHESDGVIKDRRSCVEGIDVI